MASWAIATMCKDCPEVVLAFVAHHLEAGAHEIFLFFDDPEDPSFALVAGAARVRAFRCDDAHWQALGTSRPKGHLRRQTMNADHALSLSEADWTGHIDIDEFIWAESDFGDVLAGVEADALRLMPAERIFTTPPPHGGVIFDGAFKLRMPNRRARELFGEHGPLMLRGFQGHNNGKSFLRRGIAGRLGIHKAFALDGSEITAAEEYDRARLLHFFPFGFDAWEEKFARRLNDPKYLARLPLIGQRKFGLLRDARARGDDAVWELFLALSYFDEKRVRRLRRKGHYFDPALDLGAATRRMFGPDAPVPKPVGAGPKPRGLIRRLISSVGSR